MKLCVGELTGSPVSGAQETENILSSLEMGNLERRGESRIT